MTKPPYWNHNTAYYRNIRKLVGDSSDVLDVGCGDGTLVRFLASPGRRVTGLDPFPGGSIGISCSDGADGMKFIPVSFEDFVPDGDFDAVVFSASLHHMDMTAAVVKAKSLLRSGGILIIVGLAAPSSAADRAVEVLRVIPAALSTALHRAKTCETFGIPVSYELPSMDEVRLVAGRELPGSRIRRGLYYRYILEWRKP